MLIHYDSILIKFLLTVFTAFVWLHINHFHVGDISPCQDTSVHYHHTSWIPKLKQHNGAKPVQ